MVSMEKDVQEMSQEELVNYVLFFDNMSQQGFEAKDFIWTVKSIPVNEIMEKGDSKSSTKEDWTEWLQSEQKERKDVWGYDSILQIEEYWLKNPTHEPLILAYDAEGRMDFWDGYHRFAIAVKNNLSTVPVILGELIKQNT